MGDGHIHTCTQCESQSSGDCDEDERDCAYPINMICAVCTAENKRHTARCECGRTNAEHGFGG